MRPALWIRFQLERWTLRGTPALLVILALLLAGLANLGAFLAYMVPGNHFPSYGEALWWAVLRISDTGYLSDDTGDLKIRALSVMLSVLGMSIMVGGIVAVVVQTLNQVLASMAAATTPVPFSGHVVLLGWTDRTPRLLEQLLASHRGRVVVLLEEVGPKETRRLARALPRKSDQERVILRRGNPLRKEDLGRAACADAQVIILTAATSDSESGPRSLKTLLALRTVFSEKGTSPPVVVEVVERNLIRLAEATLPQVRVLHSDRLISRALRIGLQSSGMLQLAPRIVRPQEGLLTTEPPKEADVGKTVAAVDKSRKGARLLGLTRGDGRRLRLLTRGEEIVTTEDQLVTVKRVGDPLTGAGKLDESGIDALLVTSPLRVLILGWNEVVPDLITELALEESGRYIVDVISPVRANVREGALGSIEGLKRIEITHFEEEPSQLHSVEGLDTGAYDRFVIVSDRRGSPETSDARSLAVVLELDRHRPRFRKEAFVTVELLEPEDLEIMQGVDAVVTSHIVADVLASLALVSESHNSLKTILRLQTTFVSRVLELPPGSGGNEKDLQEALRARGVAMLQALPPRGKGFGPRILVAEPVAPLSDD